MTVADFIPEVWNAAIKEPYEKALVFGQPNVASNAWMGQITGVGDTVNISALSAPTIRDYDRTQDITVEDVSTAVTKLSIDQVSTSPSVSTTWIRCRPLVTSKAPLLRPLVSHCAILLTATLRAS